MERRGSRGGHVRRGFQFSGLEVPCSTFRALKPVIVYRKASRLTGMQEWAYMLSSIIANSRCEVQPWFRSLCLQMVTFAFFNSSALRERESALAPSSPIIHGSSQLHVFFHRVLMVVVYNAQSGFESLATFFNQCCRVLSCFRANMDQVHGGRAGTEKAPYRYLVPFSSLSKRLIACRHRCQWGVRFYGFECSLCCSHKISSREGAL